MGRNKHLRLYCELKRIIMNYVVIENDYNDIEFSAKDKPRIDIDSILLNHGFLGLNLEIDKNRENLNIINKIKKHFDIKKQWLSLFANLKENDVVVFQFPLRNHSLLFDDVLKQLNKDNIHTIAIIHDLESVRNSKRTSSVKSKIRLLLEEQKTLNHFDKIVVHNDRMKQFLNETLHIDNNKMICLKMFDYLTKDLPNADESNDNSVIIAGNLKKEKAGYVYDLPEDVSFNLYGINYENNDNRTNAQYLGEFHPDEVAGKLKGKYGLVWDGSSSSGCQGIYGEYLKVNNPHKASLYLACGIPLVVWSESALADFVRDNKCGILIHNLYHLKGALDNISDEDYKIMKSNCNRLSRSIRNGEYIIEAIENCLLKFV